MLRLRARTASSGRLRPACVPRSSGHGLPALGDRAAAPGYLKVPNIMAPKICCRRSEPVSRGCCRHRRRVLGSVVKGISKIRVAERER